jgi:hypothetical protein
MIEGLSPQNMNLIVLESGRNEVSKLEWTKQLSNEEDFQGSFNLGKRFQDDRHAYQM